MNDTVLRSALLDGVRLDYGDILEAAPGALAVPDFSPGYLSRRDRLLKAPFQAARPQWRRALRTAAVILLALALAAVALWANPTTRAWVERYILQHGRTMDEYSFYGQLVAIDVSKIRPDYVPDGFAEISAEEVHENWYITYENEDGDQIRFWILGIEEGNGLLFDNEHSICTDITIKGIKGQLYAAISPEYNSRLLLFDDESGRLYYFVGRQPSDELMKMAESMKNVG